MSTRKYRKKNNRKTRKKIQGDPNTFLKNLKDVKKVQHSLLRRRSRKRIKMRGGSGGASVSSKRKTRKEKIRALIKKINEDEKQTKWTEDLITEVYVKNKKKIEKDLKSWNIKNQEDIKQNDKDNFINKLSICLKYDKTRDPDNEDIERYGPHLNNEKKVEPGTLNAKQALACAYWSFHDNEGEELKIKNNSKTSIATGVYFPPSFLEAAGYQYNNDFNIEGKNENLKKLDEEKKEKITIDEKEINRIHENWLTNYENDKTKMIEKAAKKDKPQASLTIGEFKKAIPVKLTNISLTSSASTLDSLFHPTGKLSVKPFTYGIVINNFANIKSNPHWLNGKWPAAIRNWGTKSTDVEGLILYTTNMMTLSEEKDINLQGLNPETGKIINTIAPIQVAICNQLVDIAGTSKDTALQPWIKHINDSIKHIWKEFISNITGWSNIKDSPVVWKDPSKYRNPTFGQLWHLPIVVEQILKRIILAINSLYNKRISYTTLLNILKGDLTQDTKNLIDKEEDEKSKDFITTVLDVNALSTNNKNYEKQINQLIEKFPGIKYIFNYFLAFYITFHRNNNTQATAIDAEKSQKGKLLLSICNSLVDYFNHYEKIKNPKGLLL